jgi:hypothetical protein
MMNGDEYKAGIFDRLLPWILVFGIFYFGFVFPAVPPGHDKVVHFAAHFGMSFLISCLVYAFCILKLNLRKGIANWLLVLVTLLVGSVYKLMELVSEGLLSSFQLGKLLQLSGFYNSMSQNISGMLATLLMIHFFLGKPLHLAGPGPVLAVRHPAAPDNSYH